MVPVGITSKKGATEHDSRHTLGCEPVNRWLKFKATDQLEHPLE